MLRRNTLSISVGIILFLIGTGRIAGQFVMSGEFRPRTEYRHGYKSLADPDQEHALFTTQRTRLNLDHKAEDLVLHLTLQDVRTWGNQPQLTSDDGALTTLHEGWGKALLSDRWAIKMGRQEIIYDDHRIFGNVGWAQQARSHDAAILQYADSSLQADLGVAYNQDGPKLKTTFYTVPGSYKALQYLWIHKEFPGSLDGSFLFLNNGKQASITDTTNGGKTQWKDNYSQTIGTRLGFKKNAFTAHAVYYHQTGITGDWEETEVNASLTGLDVSYTFAEKYTLTLGFERQSGNDQTDTTKEARAEENAFTPFYGTNHKFKAGWITSMSAITAGAWGCKTIS